jgi:hypothetical protein
MGDPEMSIYTDIPSLFNMASITPSGTSVTVRAGVPGATIALTSMDYGKSYFQVVKDVSSHTFTNVNGPYYVTITKHNYIPYIYPEDIDIQNETISTDSYISGRTIYVGSNVTSAKPQGKVVITNNAHVIFDAADEVLLDAGFESTLGATYEIK